MDLQRTYLTQSLKKITIHNQDCLEGLKHVDPQSISLMVTSPPYNLGIRYGTYDDTISRNDYLDWMETWAQSAARVLAENGSLFLNVGSAPSDPFIAMDVARRVGTCLMLQNVFHWIKAISVDAKHVKGQVPARETMNFGHFKPINSNRYVNDCHEFLFHFTHSGDIKLDRKAIGVPYSDKSNIGRWKSVKQDVRCRGNTWFIPYPTIVSGKLQRPHPATFPEELPERCILLHGLTRIHRVADPFMGIGTTAAVCAKLDLECLGYEIDTGYFNESCMRLEKQIHLRQGPCTHEGDS